MGQADSASLEPRALGERRRATAAELGREEALVRAAGRGDREAFLALYESHAREVYRFVLYRLRDGSRAEDVVQEVFLALYRGAARYRARAPLRAYLFRIARNRVINLRRDAKPRAELGEPGVAPAVREEQIDVRRALEELPERFREPILLATWHGLGYEEIAEVLGCPVGTVRSRISRGKERLAWRLQGSGRSRR